ncbi:MAG: hypothetical protein KGK35_01485 [Xanthomonadaceae bacterium]|nr:hypothetical protein [Xanthomonadaceae bacterium]
MLLRSFLIAPSRYFLANLSASASRNTTTAIHEFAFAIIPDRCFDVHFIQLQRFWSWETGTGFLP